MPAATTSRTADISYEDLYRRWEEGNWRAYEIDFSRDRDGWTALSDIQRRSALWTYSMFLYGEDSVTDNLSPYIDAAPREEQKYFLATQQVDEARHAVFFHRFFKEVIGAGETISDTLAATRAELNWGYRGVFGRLDRMADELRRDRSLPKFAQGIALYHMVVEAMLAVVFPTDLALPEEEIARRQIKLLRAGVLGPPNGRPDSAPEVQRLYFDVVARSADRAAAAARPLTIQWRFADAGNWHLVVDREASRAEPGDAPVPDVSFETAWKDWLDVSMPGLAP